MGEYVDADTIAQELDVTPKTVREWLKNDDLVGVKVGSTWRIRKDDFERFIDGQRYDALLRRARKVHPDFDWGLGQCVECQETYPIPKVGSTYTCSVACKNSYDLKLGNLVGHSSDEFATGSALVVPHF